jgi:hypothetical protein
MGRERRRHAYSRHDLQPVAARSIFVVVLRRNATICNRCRPRFFHATRRPAQLGRNRFVEVVRALYEARRSTSAGRGRCDGQPLRAHFQDRMEQMRNPPQLGTRKIQPHSRRNECPVLSFCPVVDRTGGAARASVDRRGQFPAMSVNSPSFSCIALDRESRFDSQLNVANYGRKQQV